VYFEGKKLQIASKNKMDENGEATNFLLLMIWFIIQLKEPFYKQIRFRFQTETNYSL